MKGAVVQITMPTKSKTSTTKKVETKKPPQKSAAAPAAAKTEVKKSAAKPAVSAKKTVEKTVKPVVKTPAVKESVVKEPATEVAEVKAPEAKTPAAPAKKTASPKTMADLMAQLEAGFTVHRRGKTVEGVITEITNKSLVIDTGGKTEGVVVDKEFDFAQDYVKSLKVGARIEAQVISEENSQGQVLLSLKQAAADARWDFFTTAMKDDAVLEAKGIDVNKGGLIVLVNGIRGFVPSSQFGKVWVGKYQQLKGKNLQVKAIEVDREKNRLIFSERHVSEADEIAQKSQALDSVKVQEIYEGVVSGVMPFGLFVTVEVPLEDKKEGKGQVEGLVHISEISWEKVGHPRDYHAVGDQLKVRVLGLDERTGKLNLSIKQLSDDPWVSIEDRYEVGTSVSGTVSRTEAFGVFVNVEPGIDGLIHSSKLDSDTQLKKGDAITVNVESVDSKQRRMSLSLVTSELPIYK